MNLIKKHRQKAGLSQSALAEKVGTSQQQIQRIEASTAPVRLEIALAIAEALGVKIPVLFPRSEGGEVAEPPLDTSGSLHTAILHWEGGVEKEYVVDSFTKSRLESCVAHGKAFMCFNSEGLAVAAATSRLQFMHLLFDPGMVIVPPALCESPATRAYQGMLVGEEAESAGSLVIHFAGDAEPNAFEVDPDTHDLSEAEKVRIIEATQLQQLFLELDGYDDEDPEWLSVVDIDGERVWFDPAKALYVEIALSYVDMRLQSAEAEEREDADEEE